MSSRVLRKLQEQEIQETFSNSENDENDMVLPVTGKKQLNINRYDLLNQASPSESEVKEDDNETERGDSYSVMYAEQAKKKKKKRKTKKRVGKHVSQRKSSEDNADVSEAAEDEIARTVREVDKLLGAVGVERETQNHEQQSITKSLLAVQHRHLNPANEVKRMFGNKVIQSEQNKRRNNGKPRVMRTTWLVYPKDNWPPVSRTGLYMNVVPSENSNADGVFFSFEHSPSYRALQEKFLAAVESMDSDNIMKIVNQQPYHVDSLLQLSELCKMSEDHAMASEIIEHAIFAMEAAFHSMFSITAGNCRLDYRRQENRAFFICLFKHAQALENRACSRTALELVKFLLSLDPENDPLAVILVLDYYALRAKQFEWLIDLFHEWEESHALSQLPNMAYSYALALFYSRRLDEADAALQYALLMFPAVLRLLLDELSIQTDPRLSGHRYFSSLSFTQQRLPLQQLTSLYVCRSKHLWRDADILPWLERNVNTVLDEKVDAKDPIVEEFAQKRQQRYINPPRPILRHIVLADYKEKVPLAASIKNETGPILMHDPLPPLDSIDIYTRPNLNKSATVLLNGSPLSMFFQSLLPSFNVQQQQVAERQVPVPGGPVDPHVAAAAAAAAEAEGGAVGGAPLAGGFQSYAELRTSLNSIVDAMRDFLSNIRVPERPNDADVDENESTEEEANDYFT